MQNYAARKKMSLDEAQRWLSPNLGYGRTRMRTRLSAALAATRIPVTSMTISKVYPSAQAALAGVVRDGMTVMSGGFGLCGIPENLILALRDRA